MSKRHLQSWVEARNSIDQQRIIFSFWRQLFLRNQKRKITNMLEDVAYQSNTQEFLEFPARKSATRMNTNSLVHSSMAKKEPAFAESAFAR